tara:strand:+ start:176 stop:469 length:294 start_codon:yes stop_codon:yes gene_type:complete
MKNQHYTLVHHTGYSVCGNLAFIRAVEIDFVPDTKTFKKIKEVGGFLYTDYFAISEVEYMVNYSPDNKGIVPLCGGEFVEDTCNGNRIYVHKSRSQS